MQNNIYVTIDFDPGRAKKYVHQSFHIVVVDVLRATSTIIVALSKKAKEVIPCAEIEEARSYKLSHNALLVGERKAEKIQGFDFTNSPFDLAKEDLSNRVIAMTTSTGTRLISECLGAPRILIGSTINAKAVAQKMAENKTKWAVIGAGSHGEFRAEDQVGCALIAKHYSDLTGVKIDSEVHAITDTFTKNIETHIRMSPSSQKLMKIGRQCDIDFVINSTDNYILVPEAKLKNTKKDKYLVIT